MNQNGMDKIKAMIESGSLVLNGLDSRHERLFGQRVATNSGKKDGSIVYEALNKNSFVKQEGSDTIIAFTDEYLIEIGEKTKNEIIDSLEKYTAYLKRTINEKGITSEKITEFLTLYSSAYSNYLNIPRYDRLRRESVAFLKEVYDNADEAEKQEMKKGYEQYFVDSKNNVPRGKLNFPNIKIRIKLDGTRVPDNSPSKWNIVIEEEKESLRNEFIFKVFDDGLWDYQTLFENGVITGLGGYDVNAFVRDSKRLTPEEKVNCFIVSGVCDSREEVLEYYLNNNKKFYVEIADIEELVKSYLNGKLNLKDVSKRLKIDEVKKLSPDTLEKLFTVQGFPKSLEIVNYVQEKNSSRQERFINKKLFSVLDRDQIMKLAVSDKLEYKNPLESKDYIDMFGKLNLEDISTLEENGLINPEDMIKLLKFNSISSVDAEEYNRTLMFVRNYYTLDRLNKLKENGKINKSFASMFNDLLVKLGEKRRKDYTNELYDSMLEEDDYEKMLLGYLKDGFDLPLRDDMVISKDVLTEMYLNEELDENFIISLYQKGFTKTDVLRELFSSDELLSSYRKGILNGIVLNFVENRQEVIREELEKGKISLEDVITLYSDKEGIDINELQYILENETLEDTDLAEFIPDDIDESKIEGLFENYFISHDDLSNLVSRGIISSEDADSYASRMNTHEIFESIFDNVSDAVLVRDTETGESKTPGLRGLPNKRAGQIKNDPDLIDMLLDEIGFDKREIILHGDTNSLDGYRVRASDKYGVMALYNFDKPGNATYVMSLQQGLFFLNRLVRKRRVESQEHLEEKVDSVESTATKQELRETEHVKVRNASRWLGRNIVDSIRKINDEFARDYRKEKTYKERIDEVIETIREDYDERKR